MTLLVDAAARGTLILLAAWIASRCLRQAAADLRHRIWATAIVAMLVLPGLLWLTTVTLFPSLPLVSVDVTGGLDRAFAIRGYDDDLFVIWALGFVLVLSRLAVGLARVAHWTRHARSVSGNLYSESVMTPITWGFWRPEMLLPAYMLDWNDENRDLVSRHESMHIQRRDWVWQILASFATAVFWFHPLVWLAGFELRKEAENATDDLVLSDGVSAAAYAEQIVCVAQRLTFPPSPSAIAMVSGTTIEQRIHRILDQTRVRTPANTRMLCALFLTAALVIIPLAAIAKERVYKIGEGGVSAPKVIQKEEPGYTARARAAKVEGKVSLQLEIDMQGRAQHIRVVKSLDPDLDKNAVNAIRRWRFEPGRKDQKPVRTSATIEVNFRLL